MAATEERFRFDVVKPDGLVLSERVDECVIPGALGYFGVRPGHAPFLTVVGTGEIWYRIGTIVRYLVVAGGFCEVQPDQVTVLAETAERAEEIDLGRAQRALERAEARVRRQLTETITEEENEAAQAALARARARVEVASKRAAA